MDISCAIMAGGKNARLGGRNKAFIKIDNATIIHKTINILKGLFSEIMLVTNAPHDFKMYENDAHIITDIIKDVGPLGGIHSALVNTTKEAVFFVACDMPFLHNGTIERETDCFNERDCDAFVPKIGNFIEPLHAVYKKSLKDNIDSVVKDSHNYSIKSFLERSRVYYWELEDNPFHRNMFRNLNTQDDLEKVRGIL